MILLWNATSEPYASILPSGALKVGNRVFAARNEGQGVDSESFKIVKDRTSSGGKVLHYLVTSQRDGHKARAEHYLHIEPLGQTFVSEFSVRLDPDFTVVDIKRPDGGPNWWLLRQWHQGVDVSPPLALTVKPGTNNVLEWGIIFGDAKGHGSRKGFGEMQVALDHWYHYRVQWNISPDENGEVVVMMSDTKLPKDLTAQDVQFRYRGPVGYRVENWNDLHIPLDGTQHEPNTVREQQGIYQGAHPDAGSRHGFSVDNVAIY